MTDSKQVTAAKAMAAGWETTSEAIDQCLGAASVAWSEYNGQRILDTKLMNTLSDELKHFIACTDDSILNMSRSKGEKIVGECLSDGEPFFVFRARDIFSVMVLRRYLQVLEEFGPNEPDMHADVVTFINTMRDWQSNNIAQVRYPD